MKNLDIIYPSVMEKCKKYEDSCTYDPNLNDLGGEYSMSKTMRKEKEQGYGICANNDTSEQKIVIFRDNLSRMG